MPITIHTEDGGKTHEIIEMTPDRLCFHAPIFYVSHQCTPRERSSLVGLREVWYDLETDTDWYTYSYLVGATKMWLFLRAFYWRVMRFVYRHTNLFDIPEGERFSWRYHCRGLRKIFRRKIKCKKQQSSG